MCIITDADGRSHTYVGLLVFVSLMLYNTMTSRHFGGLDIRREWSIGWYGECPDKLSSRVTPWLYFGWTLSSSVSHVSPSHLATFQIFASYHVVVSLGVGTAHYDFKALKTLDSSLTSWPFFISWSGSFFVLRLKKCDWFISRRWLIHFKKVCWWARIQLICVLYVVGYVLLTVVHTLVKYPGSDSRLSCLVNCRTFPDRRKISTLMETHWFTYRKQSIFIFSIIIP